MGLATETELVTCVLLSLTVLAVVGKDVCAYDHHHGTYTYCDDGYYCCDDNTRCCHSGLSAGLVVGIVLAAIFVVSIIAVVIFVISSKKKNRPGRVVQPLQTVTVGTIRQNNNYQIFQGPPQPPAYSQSDQNPYPPPAQPGMAYGQAPLPAEKPPSYNQIYESNTTSQPPPVYRP